MLRRILDALRQPSTLVNTIDKDIHRINTRRAELAECSDDVLRTAARRAQDLPDVIATTAEAAHRVIGLDMFDVQIRAALALADGKIAEMQTGEGKTLAAIPAAVWFAKRGGGVHIMTVNDYLVRRDFAWMGPIYNFIGLPVGYIQEEMSTEERRTAYACDVTYATANEVGFDYLRDQLVLHPSEQVHRPFAAAVIDEVDSILIDEARIPLVIAGGRYAEDGLANRVDEITRTFRHTRDYTIDEHGHNVVPTDAGVAQVEKAFGCGNLFDDANLPLHSAVQDSVHAHALLHRDVDYVVKKGAIQPVDEFKGRVARDRRWPAGLQSALEAKERLMLNDQGRVLGSVTMQNLIGLYPRICGMTGTAASQAEEFRSIYGLAVEVIPTHRPSIRVDHPDRVFATKQAKEQAVVEEIRRAHDAGRPVLVGTASVEESEQLSARLGTTPHEVLNARNDEQEATIIARAGQRGAVTISTNMAGRGVDIQLGDGVAELGGLYVIGTNKHESRRIDNQLRGRAGRQGDPGGSCFFLSREDPLLVKHGVDDFGRVRDPNSVQRTIEARNLEIRQFLHKYEGVVEEQRRTIQRHRQDILLGDIPRVSETERLVALTTIDDLWSDHLAAVAELRESIHLVSLAGRDPLLAYLKDVHAMFEQLHERIEEEIAKQMATAGKDGFDDKQRGATWTYLTTDQPFGAGTERIFRGLARKVKSGSFWG